MKVSFYQYGSIAVSHHMRGSCWPRDSGAVDWTILKECMGICKNDHGDSCFLAEQRPVQGLMLYNCKTSKLETAHRGAKYVALSYVWGEATSRCRIPQTIEDAKTAALALGYTYLWADQLCIAKEGSHKMNQIHQMDLIYQNAELTIIAAAGHGADSGLAGISGKSRRLVQRHARFGNHVLLELMPSPRMGDGDISGSKWKSRAWTFQEEVLSRRRLYFSDDMVWFACGLIRGHHTALEGMHKPLIEHYRREEWTREKNMGTSIFDDMALSRRIDLFTKLLRDYTRRELTYPDDKINAFLGIMNAFGRIEPTWTHLWGVPIMMPQELGGYELSSSLEATVSHELVNGLTWCAESRFYQHARLKMFPSWSWAGWERAVYSVRSLDKEWVSPVDKSICVGVELQNGEVVPWEKLRQMMSYLKNNTTTISHFIHLDIWTTQVELFVSTPKGGLITTFGAVLKTAEGEEYVPNHHNHNTADHFIVMEKWDWGWDHGRAFSKIFTALIFEPPARRSHEKWLLLVEEERPERMWAERVGVLRLFGIREKIKMESFQLKRRHIRLG
ncbi:hypothetical protein PT974_02201 [Cladobotryum mycophilum]|uniref:Heterokaryon incompatibility domain-containing protein n=1 Tax=Cladobotryum mycophilum TaxID=491253 RepID=A0ABR0SYN2_9HYPO